MDTLIIGSGGVNPSCNNVPGEYTRFPNMAGYAECDPILTAELEKASIEVCKMPPSMRNEGEVPYRVMGQIGMWGFRRAWYYWVAEGPGIPPDDAELLHASFGKVVRVDGHCGCPSPREWFKGFAVPLYHVDAQEGLNALAATIRRIIKQNEQKRD